MRSWTDKEVIDFVNWYLQLHQLDFRYSLENKEILDSFRRGDSPKDWHNSDKYYKENKNARN